SVRMQGNQIGGYSEDLKVPERWSRDFEKKRESNDLCLSIANTGLAGILIGFVVFLIWGIAQNRLRWKTALPWGWLALFALVAILEKANSIPQILASYETTENWHTFIGNQFFSTIRDVIFTLCCFWVLAV